AGLSPVHSAFFTDPPTTAASTLSLHDALPICGFLRRMSNACQFDAVHARCGYALLLKFDLDAAAQLARDLILPCRRRPHLQSYRSEEHTSELQSLRHLVCRLLLEKKKRTPRQS